MAEQVAFSPWTQWAKRHSLESEQGIYLWGRFTQDMPSDTLPADSIQENVVYIGVSCKGESCLKERWHLFDKALSHPELLQAKPKKFPRAKRYFDLYGTDRSPLYVATLTSEALMGAFLGLKSFDLLDVVAIPPAELESFCIETADLLVRYMERRLILLFARQNGCRPVINID